MANHQPRAGQRVSDQKTLVSVVQLTRGRNSVVLLRDSPQPLGTFGFFFLFGTKAQNQVPLLHLKGTHFFFYGLKSYFCCMKNWIEIISRPNWA